MQRVCMFDLDGTLLNTLPSIQARSNEAVQAAGYAPATLERVRQLVGNSSAFLIRGMLEDAGAVLTEEEKEAVIARYNAGYLANPLDGTQPYPGMVELLKALKARGDQVMVLSNKPDEIVRKVVAHFFGEDTFDAIRGFKREVPRKPDPAMMHALLAETGTRPEDVVYIGDSEVDAKFGQAAGVTTILVTYGYRTSEELKDVFADAKCASVDELATYLLQSQ